MPVCCRCNGSGRCISCSCVKSGSPCVNCLPLRNGHCNNAGIRTLTSLPKDCQHSNVPPQLIESPTSDTDQVPSRQAPTETGPPMSSSDASLVNTLQSPGVAEHASYCASTTTVEEAAHEIPQVRTLPLFKPMSSLDCIWGEKSGQEFSDAVDYAYGYIVHWKPNLFKVPSGAIGKRFVAELACLFEGYAAESAFEGFAIKAAMTLPALVLQKPHAKSKTHEHNSCLQRRLELWQKGDVEELLREGKAIQKSFKTSLSARRGDQDEAKKARKFAQLMMEGRVRATLQYLTKDAESGPLRLDEAVNDGSGRTVRDVLEDKHPDPEPVNADAIVSETPGDNFHPIVFDNITPEAIRKSALLTTGSAGPSGVTAMMWRRLCTAFGQRSNDLCSALAAIARRICTTYVDPSGLMAYTACRLVALDKCPGVRPVGVGEVVRRIIGKAIMRVVRQDLQDAVGSIQLCAGQEAGCEAAVHAMRTIFDNDDTEAMIFVDATNAFNRLNRRVTLVNCGVICPAMSTVLTNTYRDNSWLFIDGQCMLSREGTTQGDPLAMGMYAIGTQPLIRRLHGIANQVWYADDSAAGSSLERLRQWWDILEEAGSLYGYFPNGSKTHILAKPEYADAARKMFEGTGISVSTAGECYLGGAIGAASFIQQYIERKVNLWVREIEKLSKFAVTQPHAAYAAFTHGLSSRWNYLLRVTDWEALSSIEILQPLETAIQSLFIPALSGQPPPNELVRDMLALPARLGGLGLTNPVATAEEQQAASQLISAPLIERIVCQDHCLADY